LPYQSEAKLFIKYVLESKTPGQLGANGTSMDERSENVINTELEILTSLDLAQQVAESVTPQKILAKLGGGNDKNAAAAVIHSSLLAEEPKKSNVIRITFKHPDPEVVQLVLTSLIEKYLQAHGEIHRSVAVLDDFLSKETDQLRSRLVQTEDELRKAKAKAGIFSLDDTKKVYTEQISKIQQSIFDAEAELAERQASVNELSKLARTSTNVVAGSGPKFTASNIVSTATNQFDALPGASNSMAAGAAPTNNMPAIGFGLAAVGLGLWSTNAPLSKAVGSSNANVASATNAAISDAAIAEYRKVCTLLENLEKKEQELLVQFTPASPLVKSVQEQLEGYQNLKARLEGENPGISTLPAAQPKVTETAGSSPKVDIAGEMAKVTALQAKIKVLNNQLNGIRTNASAIDLVEGSITELQRKKELEEAHYKFFSANLEQSRIDEALGAARFSNISKVQAPSPPFQDGSKLKKLRLMALVGGIAAALGLAFLIELYLDRSLKRPTEIEAKLGLPLFISIPLLNGNGKTRRLNGFKKISLLPHRNGHPEPGNGHPDPEGQHPEPDSHPTFTAAGSALVAPKFESGRLGSSHLADSLRPFSETLRDRLISYFELNDLTHKPKLVAVTSCADGSGVSTIASILAASLSETGDGNVLLVDMHVENGEAHDFHRGKLTCGLDDALELERRTEARVQDNLYVVKESTNGSNLPRVLPKRFNHLMPRLKASDYDYIIFDMPAISQISVTARLSRFMDMVLLVVESEKTDRDIARRAVALLSESKTNLAVVLNKQRTHVPRLLQQEL
jgi:uncharacterized protein involved in exopolysaccharide biosynthesis/Mrp family chromosome partitioning ATPase